MVDTLTESFCERCGTRYTFESPKVKTGALSGVRLMGKGLRKLALTDSMTLDEAFESARQDDERAEDARLLEQFHGTFHLCLSCRQYTCTACWNEPAGQCLSCAPSPEAEAAALEAALVAEAAEASARPQQRAVERATIPDWPAADRGGESAPPAESAAQPRPAERGRRAAKRTRPEPATPVAASPDGLASVKVPSEAEPPIIEHASLGFRPGMSLDEAIAAYEAAVAAAETAILDGGAGSQLGKEPEAEPAVAATAEAPAPEPVVAAEPEPVVAAEPEPVVAAEPEPVVAAEPEPVVAAEPEPVVAAEPEPVVEPEPAPDPEAIRPRPLEPPARQIALPGVATSGDPRLAAWRIVAPDVPAAGDGPGGVGQPAFAAASFVSRVSAPPLQAATATASRAQLSSGARACIGCGLSLSANARFCRRCGARQG